MSEVSKKTGYFKSFDGTPVYYEIRGQGRPLILTYGIACTMNHWRHQLNYFSKSYQTIVFDYRGHHKTVAPKDTSQLTVNALANDLIGLTEHLGVEEGSFWSHSFGSQILIRAHELKPTLFKNLIFINGFADNPIRKMFGNNVAYNFFKMFKRGHEFLPETLTQIWEVAANNALTLHLSALAGGFNLKLTKFKDIEVYGRGVGSLDLNAFIGLFESMMNFDGNHVLESITCPSLIVGGQNDSVTPPKFQYNLHKKLKNSELLMVPYGTHCTQLDMPEFVNLRIEKFLKENY